MPCSIKILSTSAQHSQEERLQLMTLETLPLMNAISNQILHSQEEAKTFMHKDSRL